MSKRSFPGVLMSISVFAIVATAFAVCSFCWPPDIFRGTWTDVGQPHHERNGEISVKQKWVGDGYLTIVEVVSADSPLRERRFVLDGDAIKWWGVSWIKANGVTHLLRNKKVIAVIGENLESVEEMGGQSLQELR
jgi:hypothetical protein